MAEIQTLELVDDRFPALFTGEKINTVRWNEGDIKEGYLLYYASKNPKWRTLVWVTKSQRIPMNKIAHLYGMTPDELCSVMQRHYPGIKQDTVILFIEHLTPQQTEKEVGIPEEFRVEECLWDGFQ
jgi:hypothetical protein